MAEKQEMPRVFWSDLPPKRRQQEFEGAVAVVMGGQLQGLLKDKVDIRSDTRQSFVSITRSSLPHGMLYEKEGKLPPMGSATKQISRAHFLPHGDRLVVHSQADFYYSQSDKNAFDKLVEEHETDFPDHNFPSVIRISRRGESAGLVRNIDSWEELYTPDSDTNIVTGTDLLDEERVELNPFAAFNKSHAFFGGSRIDVIKDGQHFSVRYKPQTGELGGITVQDYKGKNKSGQVVAGEGVKVFLGTSIKPGSIVNVMNGDTVKDGNFSVKRDPENGRIVVSRLVNDQEVTIVDMPDHIDEREGLKKLFDFSAINRPFEAPIDDDFFDKELILQAFDIKFEPRNPDRENLTRLQRPEFRDELI